MTMHITWDQALAWRMRRHYLIDRASPKQIVEVVDRLRGLHAQVMSSVDLALWARIDGLRREDVADALWNKRTLVQGWVSAVVLVNGRMVGIWKHEQKGRVVSVEIEPFEKLPRWARAQIEAEAERLAAFLDADLKLTVGR